MAASASTPDPAQVFLRQVAAFNARDIDAFLATYAETAVVHGLRPDGAVTGHIELEQLYRPRFTRPPLHCDVLDMHVFGGRWVAAHERVTSPEGTVELVGVFEVVAGVIVRADMSGRLGKPAITQPLTR
jgi:hypothetical protein